MKPITLALPFVVCAALNLSAAEMTRVFLVLQQDPLAALQEPGHRASSEAIASHRGRLEAEQTSVCAHVEGRGCRVLQRYKTIHNALFIEAPVSELPTLRGLPGVKSVQRERHFQRCTSTSVPFVGGGRAWSLPGGGVTGKGMKIGVIDSGIDYNHADFGGSGNVADYVNNDPTFIEFGSFPTTKVAGGFDFVGDDYDSSGITGSSTPFPDSDPSDPSSNGHGTHVAGIASGLGVTKAGLTYNGPYTSSLLPSDFLIGPGVAPDAKLYALKVFGADGTVSSSIIVQALDWAADPNGDGNTSDHLDVVNLSLGSPFGDDISADIEADAVDRLSRLGVVVAIAAGNNGNTAYSLNDPGTAARALTVANSYDDGLQLVGFQVNAPTSVAGDVGMVEGAFTVPLSTAGVLSSVVVATDPTDACAAIRNGSKLKGKIAMIDRGTCFFSDKVRAAQVAGAIGVIMVNNVDGPPIGMSGTGDTSDIKIPGVMVTKADGARLRAVLAAGLTVTLKNGGLITHPELANSLGESSSRGPSLGTGSLKPDLSAPGGSIQSAQAGSGKFGIQYSGTSMATPHVAGAAALVRQAHPGWSVEDIKAALLNTAMGPMHDTSGHPYPESRAGAGELNVAAAVKTAVIVKVADDSGRVSLSFPPQVIADPVSLLAKVRIVNHGLAAAIYSLSSSNTLLQPGARLIPSVDKVVVPSGGSVVVDVSLALDPSQLLSDADTSSSPSVHGGSPRYGIPEASGQLWLRGGPAGSENLHLSWHVVVRAASALSLSVTQAGLGAGPGPSIVIPTRGRSVVPHPLVGLFTFGARVDGAAGEYLAVGAASDGSVNGVGSNARVFFGLAWNPGWVTPQRTDQEISIEIDTNNDGVADRVLSNSNTGSLTGLGLDDLDSANDGWVTAVESSSLSSAVAGEVWNALPPGFRDTAGQLAGRAVLAAKVGLLSFPVGQTSFRYRGAIAGSRTNADLTTGWIAFDYAKPLVDATPFGLQNTPWCDATNVQLRVNRSNASALTEADVMVFLQHNLGAGYEHLKLNLKTNDVNGNGLPDAWELQNLGDMNSTGLANADRDADGFSDLSEFLAGTNPTDPTSRLEMIPSSLTDLRVHWQSVAGRSYSLWRADEPRGPFRAVALKIAATPPVNAFADPKPIGKTGAYYRVQLE